MARRWLREEPPWTNVYGLARTLLASATALTLLFTHSSSVFRPSAGIDDVPMCRGAARLGVFCLVPANHLEVARWIAFAVLLVVASGWRPRFTGVFHFWVAFSFASSGVMIDGGDQIAQILSLLLVPVTLTDPRRWHWGETPDDEPGPRALVARIALALARLQVAGIYFHAAVGKFAVTEWADGTALYYWFLHPGLGAPSWLAPLLRPLLLDAGFLSFLTWSVLVLEVFLCTGLVIAKPHRKWLLAMGLALHLGIMVVHGIVTFGLTMFAALLLFLRPFEDVFDFGGLAAWWRPWTLRDACSRRLRSPSGFAPGREPSA
jgi:antimicrobial peptide system SdpB family protein